MESKSSITGSDNPMDVYLQVFHKLGVENADAYRNPQNIDPDVLVSEIENKTKIKMADAPDIVTKYTSTGQQQAKEQLVEAIRQNIGLTDERLNELDYSQIMRRVKDELLSRASQDAKGWDLERTKLQKQIDDLERTRIPQLTSKYEERLAKVTKQTWFMHRLLGKELTHDTKIVMNALLPELDHKYEIKSVGNDSFTIVNKDGTRIADSKGIRFLEDDEIIVRELENSGFLKQQNGNPMFNRMNPVGVGSPTQTQNNVPAQNNNAPIANRNQMSDSQRIASSKNKERMNSYFNAQYPQP